MSQEQLNTRALEVATKALVKIEDHEKTCESRYTELWKTNDAFRKEFRAFYIGAIIVLGTIIGYLWGKVY